MPSDAVVVETSREWTDARQVQQRFMQRSPKIDSLDISACCRQVGELGGDFYDFMPLPDGRCALAVGDASGKGLAAALMISNVQSSLRTAALFTGHDGAAAIDAVNRQVYGSSLQERYATLFYGVFDPRTCVLRFVNAGHQPPMVLRPDGSIVWLESGGAPVGMFPDWSYERGAVQLSPGDLLIASTDGVTEVVNPSGEEWGVDGLREAAEGSYAKTADEIVQAIFSSMDDFSRGRQTDDATVLVLRVR
jgi:sigma-B regulation protein RsbU (phosphoserine phosphatase)